MWQCFDLFYFLLVHNKVDVGLAHSDNGDDHTHDGEDRCYQKGYKNIKIFSVQPKVNTNR